MEHKKYDQVLFNSSIIDILEEKVEELAEEQWGTDDCPPEFWISLSNEDMNNQSIMITINHLDCKFTETVSKKKYGIWV